MISSTVDVAVRIRPLVPYELENGSETCVAVVKGKEKIQVVGSEKSHRFDHVFGPDVNNESFYNSIIKNKVAEVFNDRDVTILTYGQRRSGKTNTMGTNYTGKENMGIIPRAIDTVFNIINSNNAAQYKVTITFVELYNKELYDLLALDRERTERKVKIQKNESKVSGLTEIQVTNVETAMQCLLEGSQQRVTSEKKENSQSTRSHAIFTITIHHRKNVDPRITTTSKLHLVDLAGSKHVKKNGSKAQISKDLLAIRNWINQKQNGKSGTYSKYHSSKLAILLRGSLEGNSVVLIIACVSPASHCLVETLQTLRYANRLRKIKRDLSAMQSNPVVYNVASKIDTTFMENNLNLVNALEVQQSDSNIDVQKSGQSETHNNMKGEWILDAQDFNNCDTIEQLNWFQRELNIGTEDAEKILMAQHSSEFVDEVDENWDESLIRNALISNEFNETQLEKLQKEKEVGNYSEANAVIPDAQPILNAEDSTKCSKSQQESSPNRIVNDSHANELNLNAQRISNAQDSKKLSENKQNPFQRQIGNDSQVNTLIPDAQPLLGAQNMSQCSKIQQEKFQSKIDTDAKTKFIQDAHKLSNSSKTGQEEFQRVPDDDNEVPRILGAVDSSNFSNAQQGMVESGTDENSDAERISNALKLNKSSKYCKQTFQAEIDSTTDADSIQTILDSSKYSESGQEFSQSGTDADTEGEGTEDALESSTSCKTEQSSAQSGTDDDTNAHSNQNALESSKSHKFEKEMAQSKMHVDFKTQKTHDVLEASMSDESEPEIIQSKTNAANEAQKIQDALVFRKTSKSTIKMVRTKTDDKADAKKIQDTLQSNQFSKTKPAVVQKKIDEKTNAQNINNTMQSTTFSKYEHKLNQVALEPNKYNKTEREMFQTKMDNATKAESFESGQESIKFSKAQRENILIDKIEDSPSRLFSKIADYFLEPSPNEDKELRKEINDLRKKLRDRTAKLKTNIMDDLNFHERVGLSTTRRESAKLVLAKILEEFQAVLMYIVENSEIRDWIVRVFKRIRNLLDEQKKIAGKMLNCEVINDEAMDEQYAEHTINQVNRYHELQGINRCIALLEELLASLPKGFTNSRDTLRNLEETTKQIKKLEIEKVDLVAVLKCTQPLNESRTLEEYAIDKVLEMDENISRLWRKRIKQMIAVEKREKFDQQIANMSVQIQALKNARVRLVEEMKNAEKRWNSASTTGENKKPQNRAKTQRAKNSKALQKCACKVLDCLSRRCSCVRNGVSCINCNCNAELCKNTDKENNTNNVSNDSQTFPTLPANDKFKCACTTDCLNRRCTCGKNGVTCNDNCRCKPEFCKNKNKENGTTEANYNELQAPSTSTDGKMEIDRSVSSSHVNSSACNDNGATLTNCNRNFKLRAYTAKARRRLFADIDNENEGNEELRKRPRLDA